MEKKGFFCHGPWKKICSIFGLDPSRFRPKCGNRQKRKNKINFQYQAIEGSVFDGPSIIDENPDFFAILPFSLKLA
jgi:hypothetical protein